MRKWKSDLRAGKSFAEGSQTAKNFRIKLWQGSRKPPDITQGSRAGPAETDYREYHYSIPQMILTFSCLFLFLFVLFYLFYRTAYVGIFSLITAGILTAGKREQLCRKRQWELNLQFKDGLLGISAALEAGYAIENSFREAVKDLEMIYPKESDIIREFELIRKKVELQIPVEEALMDFAARSGIDDIENFAEVFITAKRSGGNLIRIVKHTGEILSDKINVKREIRTMITGKRLESEIMSIIPAGIILYLWIFSPGYLDALYGNLLGGVFMTVLLILYFAGFLLLRKIAEIPV